MAGSDKNAARSSTGRSKIEPAQPIREAESGEVAGQLLSSLKSRTAGISAVSHEAKLGMMVITILFFAFCFLLYHKMDLHQRKLTQASIASKAEEKNTGSQPLDAGIQLAAQSEKSAATDPLMKSLQGTDDSPFGTIEPDNEDSLLYAAQAGESRATAFNANPQFGSAADESSDAARRDHGGFAFYEPAEGSADLSEAASPEFESADALTSSAAEAVTIREFPQSSRDLEQESGFESESTEPGFGPIMLAGEEPDAEMSESVTAETYATEADAASLAPFDDPEQNRLQPVAEADSSFIEFDAPDDFVPAPRDTLNSAREEDFGRGSETSSSNVASLDEIPSPMDDREFEGPADTLREPVLLAMAEPQEEVDFVGGFGALEADEGISSGRAPEQESAESFPAFDAEETAVPAATGSSTNSPFGNRGLQAVTQPGSRANRNTVRTAAGSGADGKFSLAAFNYQNDSAQPAPDDGSTFDSIVVRDGDNYSTISKRVYGTIRYFSALAVFNQHRIAEPKHMRPGMIVLTPPREVLEERYPQLFVDSKPKVVLPAEFFLLEDGSPVYRVGERETLSEISRRYLGRSSRWVEILRLNQSNVKDPNKLKPGIILALPADATEVNVAP